MTQSNPDALIRILEETLIGGNKKGGWRGDAAHLFGRIKEKAEQSGITYDPAVVLERWHHLARLGVIAMVGSDLPTISVAMQSHILLTERGFNRLKQGATSPHYPERYLAAVRAKVGAPDAVVLTYLDDAVGAWEAGLYRASAVMLGCACERLVILLASAVQDANITPWSGKIDEALRLAERGRPVQISALFDQVQQALEWLTTNAEPPPTLTDALDRTLAAIFDYARGLRNAAGHPTGRVVSEEEAEGGLILFPRFYEVLQGWIDFLVAWKARPPSTP